MTQTVVERRSSLSWWVRSLLALVAFVTAIFVIVCLGIVHAASQQEIRKADAIVVFGAAEYAGRPSPVYRARLDHAFDLYQRGVALVVITTGGSAEDPSFSEGGVGHDYLLHRGVGEIMRANNMHSCVAVSDAYHVFRIRKLLEHEGVQVYVAPRPDSRPRSAWQKVKAAAREAVSYMLWRAGVPA